MKSNGFIVLMCVLFPVIMHAKVLIFTYAYNRPDFVEIQHKTFQKFLEDEYEFVVFNDAVDSSIHRQIHAICAQYSIRCIDIPQAIHDQPYLPREPEEWYHAPAVRNVNVVQYSLNTLGFAHDDVVMLIDSDMFLVKKFNISRYMAGYDLAGLKCLKEGVTYLWIGIAFLNMATMPNKTTINFNCGRVGKVSVDAGGHTHDYLVSNPQVRTRYFDNFYINCYGGNTITSRAHNMQDKQYTTQLLRRLGFNNLAIDLIEAGAHRIEFLLDNHFFHYRSGTNWNHQSNKYHDAKTRLFKTFIQKTLAS
jgi:hypothetical protein